MSTGQGLAASFVGAALALLGSCASVLPEPSEPYDLVIENGLVFDGTGTDGAAGTIAVRGDTIERLTKAGLKIKAKVTIDATGLIVAPGFIDPHTHAEKDLASEDPAIRANLPYLMQGVTTVVVGNDGFGDSDVATQAAAASNAGIGTNVAFLAGFGDLRRSVLGDRNVAPDTSQLGAMQDQLTRAMCEGAFGLSAGLYYTPQNFAETSEVAALAKIAGEHGGYYDTHLRDESDYSIGLEAAVEEALAIGVQGNLPVHIAHLKALGPNVWGKSTDVIRLIEQAQAEGQTVTADQYPWEASGTRISNALVPRWALDGGLAALRQRFDIGEMRTRIAREMATNLARRGGAERLLFTGSLGGFKAETGQTLADYASQMEAEPIEAAIALLRQGDMRVASFNMHQDDITRIATQSWVATGSDGSTGHPRKYASFPKAYRDLVVNSKHLTMAQFVRRSSSLPASIIGLDDRGTIAESKRADIVIFDPAKFASVADYANPRKLSRGVRHLIINGVTVISEGAYTQRLAGHPLRRAGHGQHPDCDAIRREN